jgi:hypothetical protein
MMDMLVVKHTGMLAKWIKQGWMKARSAPNQQERSHNKIHLRQTWKAFSLSLVDNSIMNIKGFFTLRKNCISRGKLASDIEQSNIPTTLYWLHRRRFLLCPLC